MKQLSTALLVTCLSSVTAHAQFEMEATPVDVHFSSSRQGLSLAIEAPEFEPSILERDGETFQAFAIPGEGTTYEPDRPLLPIISRFIVVAPDKGFVVDFKASEPRRIKALYPPASCDDPAVATPGSEMGELYPENFAEASEPVIIRGVRLVKVTTYPYQYDSATGDYLHRSSIEAEIRYTDDPPVNPVHNPVRRNRSPEFLNFIRALAVNGDEVGRDDPDTRVDYVGHYLVVANSNALLWHLPFIEWRRKAGYKMDIASMDGGNGNNPTSFNDVQTVIRARYNAYVNAGQEPFDQVLLIGDRMGYDNLTVAPQHQLASTRGETIWGGPDHADYKLALLEGNDNLPDVSFGRMPSGSQGIAALVVGRTLAYEMTPRMNAPAWFTRGRAYSQHWGNGVESAWHISIHTNVRWGKEVLQRLGFDDVIHYERLEWDQSGGVIGPIITGWINSDVNLMIGRAENYYYRNSFQGVQNNDVFPINICVSGHGEWTAWNMFRTGDGNNLKGPVAATFGWGGPPTATGSYVWMQMVNGTLLKDMSLGWSRMYAITSIEKYFQNIQVNPGNQPLYLHVKTDIDFHGDPGIRPWLGVPRLLTAAFPQSVSPDVNTIEVLVTAQQGGAPASNVQVTLYAPGNIPVGNVADYARWDDDDIIRKIEYTDNDGIARFEMMGESLPAGRAAYITVTGRDVRPVMGQLNVAVPQASIDLSDFVISEVEGNDNDVPNPGEVLDISLTAINRGNRDAVDGVTAVVTSLSPFVVVEENEISFGDIENGAESEADESVRVIILPGAPDAESRPALRTQLLVTFASGDLRWKAILGLPVEAPHFELRRLLPSQVIQARVTDVDFDINNVGSIRSGAITGRLVSQGIGVSVVRETARYPEIAAGGHAQLQGDEFIVAGNQLAVPGSKCPMLLILTDENDFVDTISFSFQIATARANAPQGPDSYGYIAFDDTDDDWDMAPVYEWIEINPNDNNADYDGTRVNYQGNRQYNEGWTRVVALGFETQFYGERYDRISVASNGFIAVGIQDSVENFQNWPLDQAIGGGVGMIAPFWDDLRIPNGAGVYTYYDEDNARFIVEWYRLRAAANENVEFTFQVILYDPEVWITETGDPNIFFQYKTVSEIPNIRGGDTEYINNVAFASVGISSPDGKTGLSYHFHGDGPVTSAELANRRAILFSTSPRFRSGILYGWVTDHETGEGIAEATVYTEHGFVAYTDEDGYYRIPGALAEVDFTIGARIQGYNDSVLVDQFLDENDSIEINFDLLHPEFVLDVEALNDNLDIGEQADLPFTITNTGNGPLNWFATKRLVGDADADPWTLRREYPVSDITGDIRIEGAVWVEDHFYMAGANGNQPNTIWVLDSLGELVDSYDQLGESNYGYKDLEYDGELIWGSGESDIFAFTPEGEQVIRWDTGQNPASHIAVDRQNGIVYISGVTTDIFRFDRDGNNLGGRIGRQNVRIYGLAFWPDDPDGFPLYAISDPGGDSICYVVKFNPDAPQAEHRVVTAFPWFEGTGRNGAFITNQFDVYSWVLLTMTNRSDALGGDQLQIYQVDTRRDWFDLDVLTGTLAPDEVQDLVLTLDATGLPTVVFEAEIFFSHNADDGTAIVPISLEVNAAPGGQDHRRLDLFQGWNQVSLNIEPADEGVPEIVSPLVDDEILQIVKDGNGRFYRPANNFNNIPAWNPEHGYLLFLTADARLDVRGVVIPPDRPIHLEEGWSLKSYFPREPVDVRIAVQNIADQLAIVKDGFGRFYLPERDFSNMTPMQEGRGYQFKARADVDLVYSEGEGRLAAQGAYVPPPTHFKLNSQPGLGNHSLLVIGTPEMSGQEIAVRTGSGKIAGAARFDATGRSGVAVWADNPETPAVDGAVEGERFELTIWNGTKEVATGLELLEGDEAWIDGGVTVAGVAGAAPVEFGLSNAYPNPFNSSVRISFGVVEAGQIRLAIYDLSGREVARLADGRTAQGRHSVAWQAEGLPAGVYIARLESESKSDVRKLLLVK